MESAGASGLFQKERPSQEDFADRAKAREEAILEKEKQKQKEFDDLYSTHDQPGFTLSDFDGEFEEEDL